MTSVKEQSVSEGAGLYIFRIHVIKCFLFKYNLVFSWSVGGCIGIEK